MSIKILWMLAASFTAISNMLLAYQTQSIETAMFIGLAWAGALICIEENFPKLDFYPSKESFVIGMTILLFCLWRTYNIFHLDATTYILCLLQGLGLAMLARPFNKLNEFKESLTCLTTPTITIVIAQTISIPDLSKITAKVTQTILLLLNQNATTKGSEVWVNGGGVHIAGSCSGSDSIKLMIAVAIIFILAFPLPSKKSRVIFLILAPISAIVGNSFRIGILALINSSNLDNKNILFEFFHEEHGSLLFSIITASIFSKIYIHAIDFQLKNRNCK